MKTLNFLISSLVLMLFALVGCDTDDLKKDVNTLKNRVENLDALVQNLNENVKAVQLILDNNKTIQRWTERDGTYTLTMSDGSTIILTQGSVGRVKVPDISISDDGYWVINGEKQSQKAIGDNGQTPEFRISGEGYWQMRIGEGEFADVLDENGNRVKATPEGDQEGSDGLFENVEVRGDMLVVTMKGVEYSLPIVVDLIAEIKEPESGYSKDLWYITWGATVTTKVNIKGDKYFVTVPAGGWTASVSTPDADGNAILTVTAPNASTRATANNQTELVLQVNQGINWAIDKIKVKAGEALDSELARYEAGLDLMVGGITVNKAMFGDAVHITEDIIIDKNSPYKSGAIFFVEEGKTIEIVTTWEYSFNYLIVIGNSGNQTARFKVTEGADMSYLNSNGEKERNGYFLWKNVTFDNNGGKVFYCSSESPDVNNPEHPYNFVFDDCKIEFWGTIFSFWDKNNIYFENFKIQDCTFVMNAGGQQMIDGNSGNSNNFGNVVLANNLFYSPKNTITHKLINGKGLAPNKIALSNNTFVNVAPGSNDAFIRVSKVLSHFTCTDNIFYTDGALDGANVVFFPENYESLDGRLEGSFKNNIGYRASGAGKWDAVWYGMKPVADFQPIMSLEGVANSPFEVCNIKDVIFTPKDEYKEYGVQR